MGMSLSLKKCSGGHRHMVDCSYRAVDALIEVAAGCYGRREGPPLALPQPQHPCKLHEQE